MALLYKTRGNSSPQGKPKVYFSCHPDDFLFLDAVSEEILREVNCAVFYRDHSVTNSAEHLRDLEEMNLIVVPVTTRFLTSPSVARDVEFSFSLKKRIPVLPLMQESGLAELFNKVCGNLQFLDKNARDDTAIPYKEKLRTFLNSILLGDKLAEEVRKAFDAYIFLSYRKKDREYAKKLMKLIHENEFCRDVAIWYDEFLTPGENFNDTIATALKKSKLFALAVTPNLVNETNYIMTTEYPMAKNSGKPILPVLLKKTRNRFLKQKYPEIPKPVRASHPKSLAKALTNALENIVLRANDSDPKHTFFIGLAYLLGIDVEKNHKRALSLIVSAAKQGLPEAIEKLVSMYQTGDGVKRDYRIAISWQNRLVNIYCANFNREKEEYRAGLYLTAIGKLGDMYQDVGNLKAAEQEFHRLISETHVITVLYEWIRIFDFFSVGYNRLGDIAKINGNYDAAQEYYQFFLDASEIVYEEMGSVGSRRNLAISYSRLGEISKARGQLDLALDYYRRALDIDQAIMDESDSATSRYYLAVDYNRIGDLALAYGELSMAWGYYQESLSLIQAIFQELESVSARCDLSICYDKLGMISEENEDLDEAMNYYRKSLALQEIVVRETDTVESRYNLSCCYSKLGDINMANGDFDSARKYYQTSLHFIQSAVKDSNTVQNRRALSVLWERLGDLEIKDQNMNMARNYYQKVLKLREALAKETSTIEAKRDLSCIYDHLGNLAEVTGDVKVFLDYSQRSLTIREHILSEAETFDSYRDLALSHYRLGVSYYKVYEKSGSSSHKKSALFHISKSYNVWQSLVENYPDYSALTEYRDLAKNAVDFINT